MNKDGDVGEVGVVVDDVGEVGHGFVAFVGGDYVGWLWVIDDVDGCCEVGLGAELLRDPCLVCVFEEGDDEGAGDVSDGVVLDRLVEGGG